MSRTCLDGEPEQPRYLRGLGLTLASVTLLVITNNLLVLALAWTATSLALHGLLTFFRTRPQALIAAHKKFLASRVADLCLLPVSALLHAGVVNLGGFVLIRVGALVADVPAAQALLVVVGSLTAVVAALVAMTRISIKVALAWSTCAQMGFMLMQCGLGLHELALLHLVAHSLYKAHAFLAAGTAPGLWALMFILALALVTLLTGTVQRAEGLWPLAGPAAAFALALAYFGLHAAFGHILGNASDVAPAGWALAGSVMVCFLALFVVQGTLRARPQGALARRLYPALFAGLYLDELFTRLTFRVWPARLPAPPAARTQSQTSTTGVATEI